MTGYGHLITGTSAVLLSLSFFSEPKLESFLGPLFLGVVASLLPDLDAKNSLLQHIVGNYGRTPIADALVTRRDRKNIIVGLIHALFSIFELFTRAMFIAIVGILKQLTKHRGGTHYLITSISFSLLIWLLSRFFNLSYLYPLAFFTGYTTHILGDMMTYSGVQIFAPFIKKTLYILPQRLRFKVDRQMSLSELILVISTAWISFLIITVNWQIPTVHIVLP